MCNPEANLGLYVMWVEQVQTFPFPITSALRIQSQRNVSLFKQLFKKIALYKEESTQVPVDIFIYISGHEMC